MRTLIFVLGLFLVCTIADAKIYVCLDKETGVCKGTVDINPLTVGEWAQRFTMVEADETYRGKFGYEIKYEDKKLRKATEEEVTVYKEQKESDKVNIEKQKAMEALGLTEEDIAKIKALK